jgi:hypothetical protein
MWDKSHGLGDLPINKKAPQMQGYLTFSHSSTIALGIG